MGGRAPANVHHARRRSPRLLRVRLPPKQSWWSWLGHPFAEAAEAIPRERVTPTTSGVLFEAAVDPFDDELEPLSRWLPAELFATIAPNPERMRPVPLLRAPLIPASLED